MEHLHKLNADNQKVSDFFKGFFDNDVEPVAVPMFINAFQSNITQDDKQYIISCDLPGVNKEDITIMLQDGWLTVTATKNEGKNVKSDVYIHNEKYTGTLKRSFRVHFVTPKDVSAKFENGVLFITLQKNSV